MMGKRIDDTPIYDTVDAIRFIMAETGLDFETVNTVLDSEFRYMKSLGLIIGED